MKEEDPVLSLYRYWLQGRCWEEMSQRWWPPMGRWQIWGYRKPLLVIQLIVFSVGKGVHTIWFGSMSRKGMLKQMKPLVQCIKTKDNLSESLVHGSILRLLSGAKGVDFGENRRTMNVVLPLLPALVHIVTSSPS